MASKARRQYLVNKGFQARLTMIILLLVIIVANVTGGLVFAVMKTDVGRGSIFMFLDIRSAEELLLPAVILSELVSIMVVALISLFVTHRMAGPVYRFEKVIEDMQSGRLNFSFKIRDKDEFKELASMLDSLIGEYGTRLEKIKTASREARKLLEQGSPQEKKLASAVLEKLNLMEEELEFFRTSADIPTEQVHSGGEDE